MTAVLLFLFMFVTCLMFLGMLWGDRLSFPGLFEGNWLNPIAGLFDLVSRTFGEFLNFTIEFIVRHLSWVVAAVSGTAGLILVAFLMGGGLANDANEYHSDSVAPVGAGGVVDQVEPVKPLEEATKGVSGIVLTRAEVDDSHQLNQEKGGRYRVFLEPEDQPVLVTPRKPIDGSLATLPAGRPLGGRAELDVRFNRLATSTINRGGEEIAYTNGKLLNDLPDSRFVDRAISRLLRDNWQAHDGVKLPNEPGGFDRDDELVRESPLAAVRNLEARIRVTPGIQVSRQDLRIEKADPQRSATGEIFIQVMITNMAGNVIDGLLVRELLPYGTRVRGMSPEGILHDATLTWLVNGLRPQEERAFRFTVLPADDPRGRRDTLFETQTEVSALTAVKTRTNVAGNRVPRVSPIVARSPRLRLQIAEPETAVPAGKWTTVMFRITNVGNADAEDVSLRLSLDEMLDHHALRDEDLDREVVAPIRRIAPDDHVDFELVVKPRRTGVAESTAELMFRREQLDLRKFRIRVGADRSPTMDPTTGFRR